MLLAQYLNETMPRTGHGNKPGIKHIQCFEFGERYVIRLHTGVSFDVPDLEDMLSIIEDEFYAAGKEVLFKFNSIRAVRKPGVSPANHEPWTRVLLVSVPDVTFTIEKGMQRRNAAQVAQIREAVTMYNLTQSWDQFSKGNL